MSLPPSPHSNNQDLPNNSWQEILKFARGLTIQSNVESLFTYGVEGLETLFSCQIRIWLTDAYLRLFTTTGSLQHVLVDQCTAIMDQARQSKDLVVDLPQNMSSANLPMAIALPLLVQDESLGAIQLERAPQIGFTPNEIQVIQTLVYQFSITLSCFRLSYDAKSLRDNIDRRAYLDEISQSILSNLDRDSLLNSVVSLLHQVYGYPVVNLYTYRNEGKTVLRKMGISPDGIEAEKIYYSERDPGPVDWCISHTEQVVVNDTSLDSRYPPNYFDKSIRSELALPLLQGDLVIGVLELCSDSVNAFVPDAVAMLKLLADNIATAIRNANLYNSEQIRRIIAERLHEMIGTITVDVSLDEIYEKIFDELEVFLPWDASGIWLKVTAVEDMEADLSDNSFYLASARCRIQSKHDLFDPYLHDPEGAKGLISTNPWMKEAAIAKIPLIRNEAAAFEPLGALLGFSSQYSAIMAPLAINSQMIGMLACVDHHADQYDEESSSIVDTFAIHTARAIENARLYSAAHDQAWITTVILQVIEATQSITNLDELLTTVVDILPDLFGVRACAIFLWEPSIEAFFSRASSGFNDEQTSWLKDWDITSKSVLAFDSVKQDRRPTILNADTLSADVAEGVFPDYDFKKDLMILFPLLTQNIFCGALLIDFSNSELTVNSSQAAWDEEYTLIDGATHQVAVAIENLQLIKSQEEEAYISIALLQVAQAVVSLKQLDEILGTIVRITPILVGVKRCIIYIWDGKEQVYCQSQYYGFSKNDLSMMGRVVKTSEFPFIDSIQKTNRINYHTLNPADSPTSWNEIEAEGNYIIEDLAPDSDEEIAIKLDEKALANRQRLLIGFPLSVKGENLGVMLIEEEDPIRGLPSVHIREKRIEIVKGITQQAAIAIKNEQLQQEAVKSERMERELQLAREIQAAFLPDKLPELSGWDIDVRWQPARQVGGDFYDFLQLGEDKIGFVIADVADKGMPAALFMTLIRTLIRAAAKEKSSPSEVLEQVNELLIPDAKHGMFVTIFYCVIDLQSGSMVYTNAGHNPPIIKRHENNGLVELTRTSIAIGIFTNIVIEEKHLLFNPGDLILFYTDGVTEAFSMNEEMFGKERLMEILSNIQFNSPKKLLDTIEESVTEFIKGTDLSDDITLAAFYRKEE